MPSFFDLTGHVGLVTGGNGGIGLGMARGLKAAGADVAIWGTNPDKNAAATAELEGIGTGKVLALRCDVGDEEQVDAALAETVEALGKVDSCFANAGVGAGAPFREMTLDVWRSVQRVNSEGAFLTLRAAARHMIDRGDGGRLVGISSTSAIHGAARNSAVSRGAGQVGQHHARARRGGRRRPGDEGGRLGPPEHDRQHQPVPIAAASRTRRSLPSRHVLGDHRRHGR
jgi:NAD(P)-dependent dehydrogenase (short-subunit alcohol dehydrogenase family)